MIDTAGNSYDILEDLELRTKMALQERTEKYQSKIEDQGKTARQEKLKILRGDITARFNHRKIINERCGIWKRKCDYEEVIKGKEIAEFEKNPLAISRKLIRKYL